MDSFIPLLILSLFFITTSCKNQKGTTVQNKFFEGKIEYNVMYKPYSSKFTEEDLKNMVCSKIIAIFKDGNYKKQYFSPSGELISERYLDLKNKKSYARYAKNDTIYWFDITKNDTKTTFTKLNDTIILDYNLRAVETESIVKVPYSSAKEIKLKGYYYYSKKYKVNPKWYKNYAESNFNEIIHYGKGIQLFETHQGLFWEQNISVKDITYQKIEKSELILFLNENIPQKEL